MIETEGDIGGSRLNPGREFSFACRPGLSCFNSCCRNKRLPLWPYDLLRLRRGLNMGSDQVLATYAELEFDPRSGWPSLRLKLTDDGVCPLLTPEGCGAYLDRPAACRVYPLAWAVRPGPDGAAQEVFRRQDTKGCLGWDQDTTHTTASWVEDQGLAPYLASSKDFMGLWLHPGRTGRLKLTQPQIHAIIGALYNLDGLRQAAERPGFAQSAGLDPERVATALDNDEELLLLGRDWLLARLFGAA